MRFKRYQVLKLLRILEIIYRGIGANPMRWSREAHIYFKIFKNRKYNFFSSNFMKVSRHCFGGWD